MVTCYKTPDDAMHVLLRDIPFTMSIDKLASQLERQLIGKPWRNYKKTDDEWWRPAFEQRWIWKGHILSEFGDGGEYWFAEHGSSRRDSS